MHKIKHAWEKITSIENIEEAIVRASEKKKKRKLVQKILSKDGVFVVNVISALEGEQSGVFHGIYSSIAEVFPKVLIFPASLPDSPTRLQNVMIVAFNNPDQDVNKKTKDPYLSQLLSHEWKRPFAPTVKAFSDSFAPIEKYILR